MAGNTEDQTILETTSSSYTNINNRIAEIVKKRKALVKRVEPVDLHLSRLYDEILGLEERRRKLVQSIDDVAVADKLISINFDALKITIGTHIKELDRLITRFSRDTINIGVVGRMGQGKSTFLKSLSGLTDEEIPAREGAACTAVRSKIFHHEKDTEATVIYHSKNTFLEEVLGEYYRELGLGNLESIEEFANQLFLNNPQSATHEQMYKRLKEDYHAPFRKYSHLLQDGEPRREKIRKQDIPKFVSQQRDAQQRLTTYDHLAVREVDIRCRFPKIEVHNLGLVDVPGLGDTRVADEQLILKTLEQEVDVVLFFRKPDLDRYQWEKEDLKLYEIAAQALDNLSNRSFMVLNHRRYGDKDNINGCNLLKSDLQTMRVAESPIIADCSNPDEANTVLDQVLSYLDQNIVQIEEQYARSYQNRLIDVHSAINTELEAARIALSTYAIDSRQFEPKFKETTVALAEGLNTMLEELGRQYGTIDNDFETVVKIALQQCKDDTGIPSEGEIKRRRSLPDFKNSYQAVFLICAAELRCHLSKNFLSLDQGLMDASDKLKSLVSKVLTSENTLGELAKNYGVKDIEFLEKLRGILRSQNNKLELGFNTLLDFELSYGSMIMQSIREVLDSVFGEVRPNSRKSISAETLFKAGTQAVGKVAEVTAKMSTGIPATEAVQIGAEVINAATSIITGPPEIPSDATSVYESLTNLHQEAVDQCQLRLNEWLKSPSQLRYYMAEEFVDRIFYDKNIMEEWRHFLSDPDIRAQVWIEFKQLEDRKQVHADWLNAIMRTQELNQLRLLRFIE